MRFYSKTLDNILKKIQIMVIIFTLLKSYHSDLFKLVAQESNLSPFESEYNLIGDEQPFVTTRGSAMAGSLSTLADGIHAPFYNPAGIGGIHLQGSQPPFIRLLHFPYFGISANKNSSNFYKTIKSRSKEENSSQDILNNIADKRYFARMSGLIGAVMNRFVLLHYSDTQIAAYGNSTSSELGEITTSYKGQSGTGIGFSVTDTQGSFALGVFSAFVQKSRFNGPQNYQELISPIHAPSKNFKSNPLKYQGISSNLGMLWVLSPIYKPSLAVVIRDLGGSRYDFQGDQSSISEEELKLVENENLTLGFSVTPKLSSIGFVSFILEGQNLQDNEISLSKKIKTAAELNIGDFGSLAAVGIRVGYNYAGSSMGININTGLLQFEFSSYAEDIGIKNEHVVERRYSGVFSVNVRDE